MAGLKFSILMPVYNGARFLSETLKSILFQEFTDYEIIVVDDNSTDKTQEVVMGFPDKRIRFYKNRVNLGYSRNLEECNKRASGDIIYLMGQDDILGSGALKQTHNAFIISEDIGVVTRPYYWFDKSIDMPVRAKAQLNPDKDEIITIHDDIHRIISVFRTLDQLSGLGLRRIFMDTSFHEDTFPCHVYPFASILKKHPVVFLKEYNVAVRISSSQTRLVSSIYDKSPLKTWVDLFNNVFPGEEFQRLRQCCIKNFVATNYIGLVQIRNYSSCRYLLREILLLIRYRWQNVFELKFWIFSLGCLITPTPLLIPLVGWFKNKINFRRLKNIKFNYRLG